MKIELYKNKQSNMPLFMLSIRKRVNGKRFFTIGRLYAGYVGLMADIGIFEGTVWITNKEN